MSSGKEGPIKPPKITDKKQSSGGKQNSDKKNAKKSASNKNEKEKEFMNEV